MGVKVVRNQEKRRMLPAKSNHVLELEKVGVELRDVLVVAWDGGEKSIKEGKTESRRGIGGER
jgi:hypothetical protein